MLERARLVGLLARSRILERISLTPEGLTFRELKRLVDTMLVDGHKVFTMTYHSSSLGLGHTPYVQDELDRQKLLARIRDFLTYFQQEVGGRFVTLREIRNLADADRGSPPPA